MKRRIKDKQTSNQTEEDTRVVESNLDENQNNQYRITNKSYCSKLLRNVIIVLSIVVVVLFSIGGVLSEYEEWEKVRGDAEYLPSAKTPVRNYLWSLFEKYGN
ncbi:SKG6 [Acrasis kona]|uniref:SKG6 n=1 Tax=Acrasis kona TaxID=1008807 RepID=A0AAW2Z6H2_9EUKA